MKTYTLKLRGAIALEGQLKRAGELVEVDEAVAKNLLYRGKAVIPEGAEAPADKPEAEAPADGEASAESEEQAEAPADKPAGRKRK